MSDSAIVPAIRISATGLDAESRRMEAIADNVANAQTTRGPDGRVFRRKEAVFAAQFDRELQGADVRARLGGVALRGIVEDTRPPNRVYRPGHPDADADGFLTLPNVNVVEEMVDMMDASRAYEANLAAIKTARGMANQAIELMRRQ
jgi:flagellar basal-body rod protein FlgC